MTTPRILTGLLFVGFLSGCAATTLPIVPDVSVPIQLAAPDGTTVSLSVELARTPAEHAQGLQGRTSLAYGVGMLFVFAESAQRSFWMKDTLIPLDIAFFDERGQVVSVTSMEPCSADPCPSTVSRGPARFALEVPRGYFAAAGFQPDWQIVLGPWAGF